MPCKRFTQCTVSAASGAASLVGLHVSKCIVSLELGRVDPSTRKSLNTAGVRLVEPETKIPPEYPESLGRAEEAKSFLLGK